MYNVVLIGNGFDLAHGLKTRYFDFILWYLNKAFKTLSVQRFYEDDLIKIQYLSTHIEINKIDSVIELKRKLKEYNIDFVYKHTFLKSIIDSSEDSNWVDIESNYYSYLLKLYRHLEKFNTESLGNVTNDLIKLNECFDYIKEQLIEYLISINENKAEKNGEIEKHLLDIIKQNNIIEPTLFLNFNYTSTIDIYLKSNLLMGFSLVNIHGKLNDENNPIIFGYGDEMDSYYEKIERLNSNEFLRNIKSFWYFKTRNYEAFTRFIEQGEFNVYIMGHSCGVSDRILLNSIFEHKYCRQIKIFYYQKNEKENDYFEKTQEISRHFKSNNKAKMRSSIIPFPECSPLTRNKK